GGTVRRPGKRQSASPTSSTSTTITTSSTSRALAAGPVGNRRSPGSGTSRYGGTSNPVRKPEGVFLSEGAFLRDAPSFPAVGCCCSLNPEAEGSASQQ